MKFKKKLLYRCILLDFLCEFYYYGRIHEHLILTQVFGSMWIERQIPVETSEGEIRGFELLRATFADWCRTRWWRNVVIRMMTTRMMMGSVMVVVMKGTEYRLWYRKFCIVYCPYISHRQLELKLSIRVCKASGIQVTNRYIIPVTLRWWIVCKLHLFSRESFINTEMFSIQESEGEVHINPHAFWRVSPDQIHTQNFVGTRKCDGPFVKATGKFFGSHVTF